MASELPALLRPEQAMEVLQVSRTTLHRLVQRHPRLGCKVGRLLRIRSAELQQFIDPEPAAVNNHPVGSNVVMLPDNPMAGASKKRRSR